jgi:hypothetical protein
MTVTQEKACERLNLRRGLFRSASLLRAHDEVDANEAEFKEVLNHGERREGHLDMCIEKRYHSCVPLLNCPVPRRFATLKIGA